MNVRHGLLVTLAAASVAISACSSNPPEQLDLSPSPVGATSTAPVATAAAPAGEAVPRFVWEDVSGQGRIQRDETLGREQWNRLPVPGIKIGRLSDTDPSGTAKCTLGPAVVGGFLTAGHCSTHGDVNAAPVNGVKQYAQVHPDGSSPLLLGSSDPVKGADDSAVIWTGTANSARKIAGTWPVAGVLTAAGVQKLVKPGDPVCFNGAVSGVVCGARVADEAGMIQFLHGAKEGDSGAPVFVVDSVTDTAVLIGLTKAANSSATDAVYLAPVLDHLDGTVLLDKNVTPLRGEGFSLRVAQ